MSASERAAAIARTEPANVWPFPSAGERRPAPSAEPPIGDGITIRGSDVYVPQFDDLDRFLRAGTARLTLGVSPHAIGAAWFDWTLHISRSPSRMLDLGQTAIDGPRAST